MSLVSDRKPVYGLVPRDQFGRRRRAARTSGSITNESWIRAGDSRELISSRAREEFERLAYSVPPPVMPCAHGLRPVRPSTC